MRVTIIGGDRSGGDFSFEFGNNPPEWISEFVAALRQAHFIVKAFQEQEDIEIFKEQK